MLNRYCVSCHNEKARIPAGAPLALDKANLKDPGADAGLWEKVVRKIGVGAMPPQGSPTPGARSLTKFASALAASLDAAAAKKNYPGRFVLHRLNRTEYANAVRDLLGVTSTSPSCCRATAATSASTTSRRRSRRRRCCSSGI